MIFRNSVLSITRSGGKTALFTLLIVSLTMILALGVSVWASVAQFLADCDDFYTTIGLVEFMGTGYPNDTVYDATMDDALRSFDPTAISGDSATLAWDAPTRSFGHVDGFWRTDTYMPDRMLSVLVIGKANYSEERHLYSAIVMDALYSAKSADDTIILIDEDFGTFEPDRYYLVFGEVYYGDSPLFRLRIASYPDRRAAAGGVEIPRIIDITSDGADGQFYELPEESILLQIAATLSVTNNSVLVIGTDDLMSLLPFHQQELYIVDGRAFNTEEYQLGSRVAVISKLMADRLDVSVGDTIDLSVAVSDQPGVYYSYWAPDGFVYRKTFTVVGIMNTVMDKSWYVYVPKSARVPATQYPVGYTIGQVVIRNEEAGAFAARMASTIKGRFQITLYDQGYSSVAIPFQTILNVAKIVTVVCALVELAVLILFGFLYIYRQRETSETMLMLGTGRAGVTRYFLYSAGIIALGATAAGAATAYWLHDRIIALVVRAAENFKLIDARYSDGNLTIARTLEFAPHLDWTLFFWVGATVLALSMLACTAFAVGTFLHNRPSHKQPWGPKKEHQTSQLAGGSLKYAWLSIWRGGARSLVVPVLAISVVIFLGQLATTSLRYQQQLDAIYDNTIIEGYYTDINGKQIGNQVLDAYNVGSLYQTGKIRTLTVSKSQPYRYLGIRRLADGSEVDVPHLYVPDNYFAYEALQEDILRGPDLTATNSIRKSPEFFYADTLVVTFMDGYDESILAVPPDDVRVLSCVLPSSFMAEHGIAFGDTIRVATNHTRTNPEDNRRIFADADFLVVGSYEKQGIEDTIYIPLSIISDIQLIWREVPSFASVDVEMSSAGDTFTPQEKDTLRGIVLNSTSFVLSDSRSLIAFKDYLFGYGYSQVKKVNSVREFIVLKDATFNNAVASVKQQIRYINTLYPVLYLLIGVIAIVVSYLLVVSRKREFAIIRGLGGTRNGSFFSFFFEQGILCMLGVVVGMAAWWLTWGIPTTMHLILSAGFLVCYFFGCGVSINLMNRSRVLSILLDRD